MSVPQLRLDLLPFYEGKNLFRGKVMIAGPCGAESEEQVIATAKKLAGSGLVSLFRAGVWKPRTRPGAFEGMGEEALKWLQQMRKETGLPFTVEVANTEHVEQAMKYNADVLWIGARTTVNPFSVQEIADSLRGAGVPVMVKNPVNPDLQLWMGALERMNNAGIKKLAAVHRGFHTAVKTNYRNAPMWEIAIALKAACPQLPIFCDPSHISGKRELIRDVAQRALDLDLDGLMIEVHREPAVALSDAAQQLTPGMFSELLEKLVVRDASSNDEGFDYMLRSLREVIDGIDEEILQAFARRMEVVQRIGEYKRDHGVTILQINRWLDILRTRTAAGESLGLERELIVELCQLIHKASIRRQTEVMNEDDDE